jgi:hypothetical protein
MSRKNPRSTTPLVFQKPIKIKSLKPILSQRDLKRLMVAQILSGMLSNTRKEKFDTSDLTSQAIECADRIIDLT